jgi:hypothetical protein
MFDQVTEVAPPVDFQLYRGAFNKICCVIGLPTWCFRYALIAHEHAAISAKYAVQRYYAPCMYKNIVA